MTDSLERIQKAFEDFRSLVEHCRNEAMSDMADIRDAYARLNRLRNRYQREQKNLDAAERDALRKVFEEDNFITNMLIVRVISEHVLRPEGATLSYQTTQRLASHLHRLRRLCLRTAAFACSTHMASSVLGITFNSSPQR
jgi:hypothetical protein